MHEENDKSILESERLTIEKEQFKHTLKPNIPLQQVIDKLFYLEEMAEGDHIIEESSVLKFYYIESLDKYVCGQRSYNFYFFELDKNLHGTYMMSRYLPWGTTIQDGFGKPYTYPSEPKEIPFQEWIVGWLKQTYDIDLSTINNV